LWNPDDVRVTKGNEHIATYAKSPQSERSWCEKCGGHLFTRHPSWNLIDVYAATIPSLAFKPALHVHYQESVLPIRDGLPKMRDVPKEMGGSGEVLAE
ncbi:MAG TPA: GFA family protein, partial [Casimicrobiaceae bacterium]|nr:GFA family protein [Casimicrobiaceae bacterium]